MRCSAALLLAATQLLFADAASSQQPIASGNAGRTGFRAAVVKIDITPDTPQRLHGYGERVSKGVHDRIYHRILAMDDGTSQFFLVSSDVCILSTVGYDRISESLRRQYGISPLNFWWSATHTHSAPETSEQEIALLFLPERFKMPLDTAYTSMFERKLLDGIVEARSRLAPARLGVGWGMSQANINRRAILDGVAHLGMNPDGAVDRKIGLLRIDKQDGTPLVCIANYPIHGTVLGGTNLQVSGDVPGAMSHYFEKTQGIPLLFINGAQGNLAPIYSGYPGDPTTGLGFFKAILGDKIIDAYKKISAKADRIKLSPGSLVVETPRKPGLPWPSVLNKYACTNSAGVNLVRLPVRFLKINEDVMIWSSPAELFCEISNGIRERSPFPYTFYFGLTNGTFAYMPTEAEWKLKGYETSVSMFTPSAEKDLTDAVVGYLRKHR
jgi:neutral ceramidase